MSFVLKHKHTGCYLQGTDRWTRRLDAALHFSSGRKLVDYIERGGVREKADAMEIIVVPPSGAPPRLPLSV